QLLEQAEVTGGFFSELGAELQSSWREGAPLQSGDRLGPYEVQEEIGRGGMAVVYLAERVDGAYQEKVAIKVLKKGLDTEAILSRFRHEQQLLVDLRHPHIANLLDGGETESGQPYLVMEYIEGQALDQYLVKEKPGQAERLRLFLQIVTAVQHAHQQLVVHRDLKPSNILVDQTGQVKLLDFGIAKLLTDHPAANQTQTQAEQRILTPRYAAPEQKQGGRISTATDVYQLGLILDEMLGGFQEQAMRPKSSHLPKDLAAIIGLAVREEPSRRYASATDLKLDVENFMEDRPVKARPESWGYLLQKFVRRNRLAVTAGVLLLLTLSGGIVATTWQARRAAQALQEETEQRKRAEAVTSYLKFLFAAIDPMRSKDSVALKDITMLEFVDLSLERSLADEEQDLALKVEVLDVIAELYFNLGEKAKSFELFTKTLAMSTDLPNLDEKRYASRIQRMASSANDLGKYPQADSLFLQAIALGARAYGPRSHRLAIIYNDYAMLKGNLRQYAEADSLLTQSLEIFSQVKADSLDVTNYAQTLLNQADMKRLLGDDPGARRQALEALARLEAGGFEGSV
ncbi:MAG: serine/threonine-protein kinase, partial [Bacteroidota bacterium]